MIGGCGSSGTTLLRELISAHPGITCGPELSMLNKRRLYRQPYEQTRREFASYLEDGLPTTGILDLPWLPWSPSDFLRRELRFFEQSEDHGVARQAVLSMAQESASLRELLDRFFGEILHRSGSAWRWAEKTPSNCYCIGEFLALYPQGVYIHVVRDGRDVVPSLVKRGLSVPAAVRRWMYDTACGLPYMDHPRCYQVRYEELVADPQACLEGLFAFLGEALPEAATAGGARPEMGGERKSGHASWTLQPGQQISSTASGKWKNGAYAEKDFIEQLFRYTRLSQTAAKALEMEALNGVELLQRCGYDPADGWNAQPGVGRTYFRHYLREKRGKDRPDGLDYFDVTLG